MAEIEQMMVERGHGPRPVDVRKAKPKAKDVTDRLIDGTLPKDPGDEAVPMDGSVWSSRVLIADPQWCTVAPPKREFLLFDSRTGAGSLPLGVVAGVVGEGGIGKTTTIVELAVAVATGSVWCGTYIPTQGRTLLVLGEEDAPEVQRKVHQAARSHQTRSFERGSIVTLPLTGVSSPMIERDRAGNVVDAPFLRWLRSYLDPPGSSPWRLVILDPLSRFAGADAEKDNAVATRFVEACESIATLTGATVLLSHHTSQASRAPGARVDATAARGVTGLTDGARWIATFSASTNQGLEPEAAQHLGETVTFAVRKSNYSRKGEPIYLRRDDANAGALIPLDAVDLEIIDRAKSFPAAKRAQRNAEREARIAHVEAQRADKEKAKEASETERSAFEDRTLAALLSDRPDITQRQLRAAMSEACKAYGGCGHVRVDRAVFRRGGV